MYLHKTCPLSPVKIYQEYQEYNCLLLVVVYQYSLLFERLRNESFYWLVHGARDPHTM